MPMMKVWLWMCALVYMKLIGFNSQVYLLFHCKSSVMHSVVIFMFSSLLNNLEMHKYILLLCIWFNLWVCSKIFVVETNVLLYYFSLHDWPFCFIQSFQVYYNCACLLFQLLKAEKKMKRRTKSDREISLSKTKEMVNIFFRFCEFLSISNFQHFENKCILLQRYDYLIN